MHNFKAKSREKQRERERIAALNRARNPDVAALVDILREEGVDPQVKYVGPVRESTKARLASLRSDENSSGLSD